MREYTETYGDFVLIDGTHNMTAYDLVLCPYTVVDGFGKTVMVGGAVLNGEKSDEIVKASELFNLNKKETITMTDEGSGLILAVETLGQVHLLCSDHFSGKITKAAAGMTGDERRSFF